MLGPTSLPTIRECLKGSDETILNFAWQAHDNSCITWTEPSVFDDWVAHLAGKHPREMSLEEFTYWAGLLQGEALREYVENFRRRMFDSGAAVFWMFNDCWPATRSWTTVDYDLRRTPGFHPVRRAMAPVHVVVAQEDERVTVFGVNDTPAPVEADLRFGVFELTGGTPIDRQERTVLPANASTRLASFALEQWRDPSASAAFAILRREDGGLVARNRLFLPDFREVRFPRAQVRVELREGQANFRSDAFAWGVCLDLAGEAPLADNFFDVYPGIPHVLPWPHAHPPRPIRHGSAG
jgi:beta-mannosidase